VLTLWEQSGRPFKKRRAGLHHLAFEADSVEEVNRTKGLLENLGARWSEGAKLYEERLRSAAIHFNDPDGIRIELYCPGCAETALGKEKTNWGSNGVSLMPADSPDPNTAQRPAMSRPAAVNPTRPACARL
jgi:hypothetical protein